METGFQYKQSSVLTKRTIMTAELGRLLECVIDLKSSSEVYRSSVLDDNCLQKRTCSNRKYTLAYLQDLYGLSFDILLFRGLRYFIEKNAAFDPQIAALSAFVRDSIYRDSFPFIKDLPYGARPSKELFERFIDARYPERFSVKMLGSLIRNLLSSWTQSGHLEGRTNKVRTMVSPTPASVAYGLYLGYLQGIRGQNLLLSDYLTFLDCNYARVLEFAEVAAARGWIDLKRIGDVVEIRFPSILSEQEVEWVREQN